MADRHVLGLSGGRDSAALAVFMQDQYPHLPVEYFFTDTGSELPEVYSYLDRLEALLGKTILRLDPGRDFLFWLREYNHFLPSVQQRWCTRQMKLRPFEKWVRPTIDEGGRVYAYVAIRADEDRGGYSGESSGVEVRLPFREHGIDKAGVIRILKDARIGMPEYYRWRSRSGCTFCFFQQKIEWVRLLREYPDKFEEARRLEKTAIEHGSPYTWSDDESLDELASPERISAIEAEYEKRLERLKIAARAKLRRNPYYDGCISDEELDDIYDIDAVYGLSETSSSCVTCHK
jgi:hypothetical protein